MRIKDLDFKVHPAHLGGTQAIVKFPNGYGASIITGYVAYSSEGSPYEIAVLHGEEIDYTTHITDDVCGHLTEEEADKMLAEIEALPLKEVIE